jgi:hypothetical protein
MRRPYAAGETPRERIAASQSSGDARRLVTPGPVLLDVRRAGHNHGPEASTEALSELGNIANSHHPNHTVQTRALHAYLRWRNANARHPGVLAAERKERARVRSEKGIRWGGRPSASAA